MFAQNFANIFTDLIVQPIFNLLVLIYNVIPGHNFGLAVILFTITIRLLLWPLVKKQLHQTKLMRRLQPELKRIKQAAKGDRQKEALLMMELYKERGVRPLRSIGLILLQAPILIGLYLGLQRIVKDPHELINFSYPFIQNFGWMQELSKDISMFDETLFGLVDLTRAAVSQSGIYWPALLLVTASAVVQYYQSKQLMPIDKDSRSLRQILKEAGQGKQADQTEMQAAINRNMLFLLPLMVFLFTVNLASALSLYWLVGGIVAFIQQSVALRDDEAEMEKIASEPVSTRSAKFLGGLGRSKRAADASPVADKPKKAIIEGEIVAAPTLNKPNKKRKAKAKKRRK